jgi:ryanodine receptor 2
MFCVQEEKFYVGTGESFGKQWSAGDCVGAFLDLVDRTISKYRN